MRMALFTIVSLFAGAAMAGTPSKEQAAILDSNRAFAAAWSKGDAKALASFYAEDGIRVGAFGDRDHGRSAIESAYAKMFDGPFKGASIELESPSVRMLGKDYALCESRFVIHAGPRAIQGESIDVYGREKGAWKILESHPKIYPPPPSPAPSAAPK